MAPVGQASLPGTGQAWWPAQRVPGRDQAVSKVGSELSALSFGARNVNEGAS